MATLIARNLKTLEKALSTKKIKKKDIGLVPTMGAIHEGHLALVDKCLKFSKISIVTIFVNPIQFTNKKDLKNYPSSIKKDINILKKRGVDIIFIPKKTDMYPAGFSTFIELKKFDNILCGKKRRGHFSGVATVVLKLFSLINPHFAFFGEKDYQQLFIIKKLVKDLNIKTNIKSVKTVRDGNGLALSSRNRLLTVDQKKIASKVNVILKEVSIKNLRSPKSLLNQIAKKIHSEGIKNIEYLEIRNEKTLDSYKTKRESMKNNQSYRIFIAVKIGSIRLIDNIKLSK